MNISFCHFDVRDVIKHGNASFSIVYSFRLAENGRPTEIAALHDGFVGEEVVSRCLENWEFRGIQPGSEFALSANWKHGIGWVSMSLVTEEISQTVNRFGDLDPY
jgi:hypothetical protein